MSAKVQITTSKLLGNMFPSVTSWLVTFCALFAGLLAVAAMPAVTISIKLAAYFSGLSMAAVLICYLRTRLQSYYALQSLENPTDAALQILQASAWLVLSLGAIGLINTVTTALCFPLADAQLIAWDKAIGLDWNAYYGIVSENDLLRQILSIAYHEGFAVIVIAMLGSGIFLKNIVDSSEVAFVIVGSGLVVVTIAGLMPAYGAWVTLAEADIVEKLGRIGGVIHLKFFNTLRSGTPVTLDIGSMVGMATFPSYHSCLAVAAILTWRKHSKLRYVGCICGGLILMSVPIFGGHYLVDVIAGCAVVVLVWSFWLLCKSAKVSSKTVKQIDSEFQPAHQFN
jgi:PAP2 superfamily